MDDLLDILDLDGVGHALMVPGSYVEMEAFVAEHNAAIDGFSGADYRVLCDLRGMSPLSPESSAVFERAKAYSASVGVYCAIFCLEILLAFNSLYVAARL